MVRKRTSSLIAAASAAALIAAGCGAAGSAGSSGPASAPARHAQSQQTQPPPDTSLGTVKSVTLLDANIRQEMKRYLTDLAPMRHEVQLANRAAHHATTIASSGDFPALAADTRRVELHLTRAVADARRVHPPSGLGPAHANLVRSFQVGERMAARLAALYDNIGPDSNGQYRHQVLPLEKRAVRLGNAWLGQALPAMSAATIREPAWVEHLYDWS